MKQIRQSKSGTYGTDTFTKNKVRKQLNGEVLIEYQVTATFDWDTSTRKVQVYDVVGEVIESQGDATISKEKTSTSGNNTSKATGKYSFSRTTHPLEYTENFSISVSCNYKGVDS